MKKFSLIFFLVLAIVGGACLTASAANVIVKALIHEGLSKDGPFSSDLCFYIYDNGEFIATISAPPSIFDPDPEPIEVTAYWGTWEVWRDVAILKGRYSDIDPQIVATWAISLNTLRGLVTRLPSDLAPDNMTLETGYVYVETLSPSESCFPPNYY